MNDFSVGQWLAAQFNPNWETVRFSRVFIPSDERNGDNPVGIPLSISGEKGVVPRNHEVGQKTSEDVSDYRIVRPGQLAANMMWLNYGGLGISDYLGYVSPVYQAFNVAPQMNKRFAHHLLRSRVFTTAFQLLGRGVRPNSQMVPSIEMAALPVPLLSDEEQNAIADFLDRETSQIDAMIEAQEDVLSLAEERRRSIIAEEIDGLPDKGHSRVQLRHCVSIQTGVTLGKNYGADAVEYPYVRVANVQAGRLDLDVIKTVEVSTAVAARSTLKAGDVLITEGGDRAALGRGALWRDEIPGALHQNHIFALRCKDRLDPEFLVYALDAPAARMHFEMTRTQTTNLSSTNSAKVKSCKIPLPPIEIQRNAVQRLHNALSRIDETITAAREIIILLHERRDALITAAVTGRIDPHTGIERVDHPDHSTLVNV